MRLLARLSALLLSLLLVPHIAAADSLIPQCPQTCAAQHTTSSSCSGDEKGDAHISCICATLVTAGPLINCVKQCPTAEQEVYAASVPEKCRSQVMPGVSAASSGTESTATTSGVVGTAMASPGAAMGLAVPGLAGVVGGMLAALAL